MPQTLERRQYASSGRASDRLTGALLAAGVVAGPIYVAAAAAQTMTRAGFDIRQHAISLLSNGEGGWIQITNFAGTGLLTVLAAMGAHRVIGSRHSGIWWSRLIAVYGLSLIAAGLLVADPALGFPLGTPEGPPTRISWHGLGHFLAGGVGFVALTAACLVSAWRLGGRSAMFSAFTGIALLASFLAVASGAAGESGNLAFAAAVTLAWAWLSVTTARMLKNRTSGGSHTRGAEL